MSAKTMMLFRCPSCNASYEGDWDTNGSPAACGTCRYEFTIEGYAPASDPELHRARVMAATLKNRLPDLARHSEPKESQKLFDSADNTNSLAIFFFLMTGITLILSFMAVWNGALAFGGGLLALGLTFKVISQLIYIRAELRAQREQSSPSK